MQVPKGKVIVIPIKESDTTESGIKVMSKFKESTSRAMVVSVGEDISEIKSSETIVYKSGVTIPFTKDDQDYLIISVDDVLCIV